MKLRAEICIEIEADDYIAAADHQRSVETLFGNVKAKYGQASLAIRQLRERQAPAPAPRARRQEPRHRHHTGNLALYKEH
jgi:hypothetical protein